MSRRDFRVSAGRKIYKIKLTRRIYFMDCRSEDRRKQIVEEYNVVPKAHIKLLSGQEKISDAGGKIEREYYIFEATSKESGNREIILCGMGLPGIFLSC